MNSFIEVKYVGPQAAVEVDLPDGSFQEVAHGGTVTTSKDHAESLLNSPIWERVGRKSREDFEKAAGSKEAQAERTSRLEAVADVEARREQAQKVAATDTPREEPNREAK